jgi:FkbM family methyltransferase
MNLSRVTFSKIGWLIRSPRFRHQPLKVFLRVLRWEWFRKVGKRMLIDFDGDLRAYLYPNDGVARLTFYFGYHEGATFHFMRRFLQPGMTYFDVGANIGFYSIFAAKRVGPSGHVVAFEPQQDTFQRMLENISLNNLHNIQPYNIAIANKTGILSLHRLDDSSKSFTSESDATSDSSDTVESTTLDHLFHQNKIAKPDYVKIDVEGFELNVLLGMKEILQNSPPTIIQLELYEAFLMRNDASIGLVESLARQYGYGFYLLDPLQNKLRVASGLLSGDVFLLNSTMRDKWERYVIE